MATSATAVSHGLKPHHCEPRVECRMHVLKTVQSIGLASPCGEDRAAHRHRLAGRRYQSPKTRPRTSEKDDVSRQARRERRIGSAWLRGRWCAVERCQGRARRAGEGLGPSWQRTSGEPPDENGGDGSATTGAGSISDGGTAVATGAIAAGIGSAAVAVAGAATAATGDGPTAGASANTTGAKLRRRPTSTARIGIFSACMRLELFPRQGRRGRMRPAASLRTELRH